MIEWTYARGRWTARRYDDTERSIAAREWFRKERIARRWAKYVDRLGPVPARYADIGECPSLMERTNRAMIGYMLPQLCDVFQRESPLLAYLRKR